MNKYIIEILHSGGVVGKVHNVLGHPSGLLLLALVALVGGSVQCGG